PPTIGAISTRGGTSTTGASCRNSATRSSIPHGRSEGAEPPARGPVSLVPRRGRRSSTTGTGRGRRCSCGCNRPRRRDPGSQDRGARKGLLGRGEAESGAVGPWIERGGVRGTCGLRSIVPGAAPNHLEIAPHVRQPLVDVPHHVGYPVWRHPGGIV